MICDFIRNRVMKNRILITATIASSFFILHSAFAFEGHITASQNRNGDIQTIFYTVGTNALRIERGETNRPYARNLIALDTGAVTLLFPLLATVKFESGGEYLRFEVKSILPTRIEDKDGSLFQPPPDYHELDPLPF
jgi:hypothetical protein